MIKKYVHVQFISPNQFKKARDLIDLEKKGLGLAIIGFLGEQICRASVLNFFHRGETISIIIYKQISWKTEACIGKALRVCLAYHV